MRIAIQSIEYRGLQVRAAIDKELVREYVDCIGRNVVFPPIVVYNDGVTNFLADGFHRVQASIKAGLFEIEAEVRSGSREDAQWFACEANKAHGKQMNNADKRRAVTIALGLRPSCSNVQIADHVGVSDVFVGKIRKEAESVKTRVLGGPPKREKREGSDGKSYSQPEPKKRIDSVGREIPSAIIQMWDRAEEYSSQVEAVKEVIGTMADVADNGDPIFSEIKFKALLADLKSARDRLKCIVPYAVCPECSGVVRDRCMYCDGRGFVSELKFEHITKPGQRELIKRSVERGAAA